MERDGKPKPRDEGQRLENQEWYHGVQAADDIKSELKQYGDYLVRAEVSKDGADIYLMFRSDLYIHNVPIQARSDHTYCVRQLHGPRGPLFRTMGQLIDYYKINPLYGYCLANPVKRPTWLLQHKNIVYKVGEDELGAGNFCTVYKGKYTKPGGEQVDAALKVCSEGSVSDVKAMIREAKLMSNYNHPNVVYLIGVACNHPPVIIALEFCAGGALDRHLMNRCPIHELELLVYCMESARGMRYLHTQRCIHRDLAARNCLISATGMVKIADFGLSKLIGDRVDYQKDTIQKNFPLRWAAPELFNIKKEDREKDKPLPYSKYSDVWAWGILCYEIYNKGVAPFAEDMKNDQGDKACVKKIAKKIRNLEIPSLPQPSPEFLRKILGKIHQKRPESRPKFTEVVRELVEYLFEHETEAPEPKDMAVNKINGVNRTKFLMGTKEELLAKDEVILLDWELKAHVEKDLPRKPSERRNTRRRSRNQSESKRHIRTAVDRSKEKIAPKENEKENEAEKSSKAKEGEKPKMMAEKSMKASGKTKDKDRTKDGDEKKAKD